MSICRKIFGLLMALAMVVGMMGTSSIVNAEEETYDIVVSKIKMDSLKDWPKEADKDTENGYKGNEIKNLSDYFGKNSKEVDGVYFEVHKETENGEVVASGATENGSIKFTGLKTGKYVITENKSMSKYKDDENNELANSKAVPMVVMLPVYKADGTKYTTDDNALHVYPKSTVSKPSIKKFVGENQLHDTALIGENKKFTIESVMPEGIKDYKVLNFIDTMDKGLDYKGNLEVKVNDTKLSEKNDYIFEKSEKDGNTELKIEIKDSRIKELKPKDKITISYNACINSKAVMGAPNENKVLVQYTTNSSKEALKENKPVEFPEIHTGGIKFKKVDGLDGKALKEAKFVVLNSDKSKGLKDENGKYTWVPESEATKFETKEDGIIDIKGLPYGDAGNKSSDGETSYYLKEVEAPEGYAKLTEDYKFKINAGSYYSDIKALTEVKPTEIKNNKITIPQTGGKGAIKIVAVGFVIVAAGLAVKKKLLNN